MAFTETLTERFAFVGFIGASNHTTNTDSSIAGIDMSTIRRLITILDMGTAGAGNVQVYYRASANANMNVTTNCAAAIPLTVNTTGRISTVEIRADQLPAGTRYVQPVVIVNGAASSMGVLCIGDECAYKPGKQFTIANTVDTQAVT